MNKRGMRSAGCGVGKSKLEVKPGVACLTKAQMAAALQVCPRTITAMMGRGEISYFKIGSRVVRIPIEEALRRMGEPVLNPLIDANPKGILPQRSQGAQR